VLELRGGYKERYDPRPSIGRLVANSEVDLRGRNSGTSFIIRVTLGMPRMRPSSCSLTLFIAFADRLELVRVGGNIEV
jgi:hypothetical protein